MSKITLAIATIIKNEESNMERMLRSLKDDVDEMVLVDTGSTDRTIDLARSLGATVLERPWDNDFSAARNYALENATSDWIIHLDADEELDEGSRGQIKKIIQGNTDVDAFNVYIENFGVGTVFSNLRIFKRNDNFRYTRKIHEALTSLIKDKPLVVGQSELKIIHHGYNRDQSAMSEKDARNEELLNALIKENPDDLAGKYYLAALKAENSRDVAGALQICKEILEGPKRDTSVDVQTALLLAHLLLSAERYSDVVTEIKKLPQLMNYNPMLAFYYGVAAIKLGNYNEAISAFNFCLHFDKTGPCFGLIATNLERSSLENLMIAYIRSNQLTEAESISTSLLRSDPKNQNALKFRDQMKKNADANK